MNKKDVKIISINGIAGLLILTLTAVGIFSLIFILPVIGIKESWNLLIGNYLGGPVIWHLHAALLWTAVLLFAYTIVSHYVKISFNTSEDELDDEEIHDIIQKLSKDDNLSEKEIEDIRKKIKKEN